MISRHYFDGTYHYRAFGAPIWTRSVLKAIAKGALFYVRIFYKCFRLAPHSLDMVAALEDANAAMQVEKCDFDDMEKVNAAKASVRDALKKAERAGGRGYK